MSALNGEIEVFGQHNAGDLQLRIFGDEFYARYETLDGFTVVYDSESGRYCYVSLAEGQFVSTGIPVGKPVPAGLRRHLKELPKIRNDKFERRYMQLRPPESEPDTAIVRTFGPDGGLLDGRKLFAGEVRGLTILVDFDDTSSNISQADVDAMMNADNYRVNGNFCSVKEYYHIVSNGNLTYTNRVVGPVKLKKRRSHYISTLLVTEVMDSVVNDHGIDLSDFDSRNEGIVDAINILYAGNSQYSGNLWPHNSVQEISYDGIKTHFYMLTGLGRERVDLRIGTICHENGHMLCRFPDMYDYGKRDGDHEKSQGIGRYCLMGSGNHLDERRTPSPVCAYLRYLVGWADNLVLLNNASSYAARHGDYGTVMKYETDKLNEYFLIENRSNMGLDKGLPSSGLAVYHCDTLGSNEWQEGSESDHYQCALLQADGHMDLEQNVNPGDSEDLYSVRSGIALSDETTPSSRQWSGVDSGLLISDIGPTGEAIDFTVGNPRQQPLARGQAAPALLIPDNDPQGVASSIVLSETGTVTELAVRVEIIHSWISDLQIKLIAPQGIEAVLHDHQGQDGDDIMTTWRTADTEALRALTDSPVQGGWQLHITDTASADVGNLEFWSLEVAYAQAGSVAEGVAERAIDIPDDHAPGIESIISLDDEGSISDILVGVDIEHSYIGDLQIDLVSPGGISARLHNNEGRNQDNLVRSWDLSSRPELQLLLGQPVKGDWVLKVRDLAAQDAGVLKRWSVKLNYS